MSVSQKDNLKKYWNYLRTLAKRNDTSSSIPILKTTCNNNIETYHYTDSEKANCLNDYFASISTVDDANVTLPHFVGKCESKLTNIQITTTDIISLINTLTTNKALVLTA